MAVALSVDGLNTIDARQTTAAAARKWVLDPYQTVTISGWQTSRTKVRRFEFMTKSAPMARRWARPATWGSSPPFSSRNARGARRKQRRRPRSRRPRAHRMLRRQGVSKEKRRSRNSGHRDGPQHRTRCRAGKGGSRTDSRAHREHPLRISSATREAGDSAGAIDERSVARRERAVGFEPGFCPLPSQRGSPSDVLPGSDVVFTGPRGQPPLRDPDIDIVDLAVAFGRSEPNQILAVQFVGHLGKRGGEVLTESNFGVSAAGFLRDPRQPGIGRSSGNIARRPPGRCPAASSAVSGCACRWRRPSRRRPRAIDDVRLADVALVKLSGRCPCRRSARERPGARSPSAPKASIASSIARQSGVGASGAIAVGQRPPKFVRIARERSD